MQQNREWHRKHEPVCSVADQSLSNAWYTLCLRAHFHHARTAQVSLSVRVMARKFFHQMRASSKEGCSIKTDHNDDTVHTLRIDPLWNDTTVCDLEVLYRVPWEHTRTPSASRAGIQALSWRVTWRPRQTWMSSAAWQRVWEWSRTWGDLWRQSLRYLCFQKTPGRRYCACLVWLLPHRHAGIWWQRQPRTDHRTLTTPPGQENKKRLYVIGCKENGSSYDTWGNMTKW